MERVMLPSELKSGPEYSVMRLALNGADVMLACPMMVFAEVFELIATLVVHSAAVENPKRFARTPVLPFSLSGIVIVTV